mgnify:CR=1 FL=1
MSKNEKLKNVKNEESMNRKIVKLQHWEIEKSNNEKKREVENLKVEKLKNRRIEKSQY